LNYPYWQLGFPGGVLIALVAVLHVFVSHFAVGGGFFLVATEARARRTNDAALLAYCKRHATFFALLTLVFGAVSGVGIWFTIGLVSPEATSTLIHAFVWLWAIEWVFFFVEIAAAIIYAKTWETLSAGEHQIIGWIYFVAAWMSLFVINGILTFMLTPGGWLEGHSLAAGFFNPTYWPSLLTRTAAAVVLAGLFAFVTLPKDGAREQVARLGAKWMVAGAVVMPLGLWWWSARLPLFSHISLGMGVTSVTHALRGGVGFSVAALLIALVCGAWKPAWMRPPVVVVLVLCGIGMVGAGEYLREYLRKPWAVNTLVYANDVRASEVAAITANGVMKSAKFLPHADAASPEYGRDLFVLQCGACHAVEGYRSMTRRVDGWDAAFAADILQHIHMLRGTMPPFAGDEQDRKALGKYLAGLNPEWHLTITAANKLEMGKKVFDSRCGHCHTVNGSFRPLRGTFEKATAAQVQEVFPALSAMSSNMPDFNAPADQAEALGFYIAHEANLPLPANTAPAQMPTGTNHSRMRRPVKPGESATAMAKVNQNSPAQEVR